MVQEIKRLPDWRSNLCAYLSDIARAEFRPGVHDCALFGAGAVKAMTGVDLAADYIGRYGSVSEGMALLKAEGINSLNDLVSRHFPETPPLMARAGDLALVTGRKNVDALGVVQGPSIFVLQVEGLGRVPLSSGLKGFNV